MPKWAIGAGEIAGGIAASFVPGLNLVSSYLIGAGVGTVAAGIGDLLTKGPVPGVQTASINPIKPRNVVYGRTHVGGTRIWQNSFDENDKYLDLVYAVATHPCENVDQLLVNGSYVPIDPTTRCSFTRPTAEYQFGDSDHSGRGHTLTTKFNRTAGLVTVTVTNSSGGGVGPYMQMGNGDKVLVDHMPSGGGGAALTLQGTFPVTLSLTNPNVFFYTSPGPDTGDVINAGHITTVFVDYKSKIYMENLLGTQTLGTTFDGMINGTTYDGDLSHAKVTNPQNPWTAQHSGVGCTLVFIRLHYNDQVWASGLPQFSFIVKGKNDIYDPRTSTRGWTDNSALCIADYLTQQTWGIRLNYVTDVPYAPLIAAANICDEAVSLAAGGTEPRYTCNGMFELTSPRGDILDNMLTSCAGRRTNSGGQWVIWPGAWQGTAGSTVDLMPILTAPLRWHPKVKSRELFNAIKGTFISEVNSWQSSDYPAYLQNLERGFSTDNYLAQDGGERRYLDAPLAFTNSASMAQRIAKIYLGRHRFGGTATFTLNMSGYVMTPLDVWPVDFAYTDFSAKQFEILNARLTFNRVTSGEHEVVVLGTEVDAQETDSSIYDWSPVEELTPSGYKQGVALSLLNLFPPTNLVLLSDSTTALLQSNGLVKARILATWTDPTDGFFTQGGHIELQYQFVSSPPSPWNALPSVLPGIQQLYIDNVQDGDSYNVEVRSVNTAGVPSDWVVAGPVTVSELLGSLYGPNGGTQYPVFQDAIYPQATFGLLVTNENTTDGSVLVGAEITPAVPANVFSALIDAPILSPTVTQATTGGSIAGGQTFSLGVAAIDSAGSFTALSDVILITIPAGTNTNTITLTFNNYAAGMTLFLIYTGSSPGALFYRRSNSAAASITLTTLASVAGDSYPVPDANFDHFVVGTVKVLLAGSFGGAVGATSTITAVVPSSGNHYKLTLSGAAFTPSTLVGRVLSSIVQGTGNPTPLQDYAITANDATSVTVVAPPPGGWGGPSPSFTTGDQVVVRIQPTFGGGGTTVSDSLLAMATDDYQGDVLRVFYADGTNQSSFIAGNSATTFTLDDTNNFTGTNPVRCWVEASSFSAMVPQVGASATNFVPTGGAGTLFAAIDNLPGFVAFQLFAANAAGTLSDAPVSPLRDAWWSGAAGIVTTLGYNVVTMDGSGNVNIDLAAGKNVVFIVNASTSDTSTPPKTIAFVVNPINTSAPISNGDKFWLYIGEDPTTPSGGWPGPAFDPAGFGTDVNQLQISPDAGKYTLIPFTFHGKWVPESPTLGMSLT